MSQQQAHLLNALQALQGQTITPELLQSLMSSMRPPPPPPPPYEDEETAEESVDDLLIAQQVAEHDKRILASLTAPQISDFRSRILDPFADQEFSDSDSDDVAPRTIEEISDQRSSLDALLSKHNLTAVADEEISDQSEPEDLVNPEIFASIPDTLPLGESEISAGIIESILEDGKLAVISGSTPLDVGTSLALKNSTDRSILAVVVDTFGSVSAPLLLAVARPGRLFVSDHLGAAVFTVPSLAQQILLDEANGVFAIRGQSPEVGNELEDISEDEPEVSSSPPQPLSRNQPPPPPPPQAPRAPQGFSWKF